MSSEPNRLRELSAAALFGLPLVLGIGAHAIFQLADTFLIGQLGALEGPRAISVTGLSDPITTLQTILFNGLIAGAGILLAAAFGKKDSAGFRDIAQRSMGFIFLLSALIGIPGYFFAEEIARVMGAQAGWQLSQCTEYLEIFLLGGFTAGLFLYLTTVDRSANRTGVFMMAFLLSNLLNVLLGILFIFGSGPTPNSVPDFFPHLAETLGIERMGVMGSAWSTVIARGATGLIIFAALVIRRELGLHPKRYAPVGGFIGRIMRIGIWNNGQLAVHGIAIGGAIRIFQWASGGNEKVVAGLFIAIKVDLLLTLLAIGWGTASQNKVAAALATGDFKRAAIDESNQLLLALMFNTPLFLGVLLFPEVIAGWFTTDVEAVFWAARFLAFVGAGMALMPIAIVVSQTLVARGRLRLPVILDGLGMLVLMLPLMLVLKDPEQMMWAYAIAQIGLGLAYGAVYLMQRGEERSHGS
ncbi:MATE family efflux transporter [Planctomycetota bacterium]|nr:MATE family efflux transporter [Planctomycetota bacterium]